MKVGTLLRGTQNKDWGVVYKNDGRKIHIFWHKREYKEKLSIQFLNKCIAANLIEVTEEGALLKILGYTVTPNLARIGVNTGVFLAPYLGGEDSEESSSIKQSVKSILT